MQHKEDFKKDPALNRILFKEIIKHLENKAGVIGVYAPVEPKYNGVNDPLILFRTATDLYEIPLSRLITAQDQQRISNDNDMIIKKVDYSLFNYAEILPAFND